mgnify:CR=1 FL=1
MKTKILKIKIGEVFIDGKSYDVFKEAWQKESKDGTIYYETKEIIFVNEVEIKKEGKKITA